MTPAEQRHDLALYQRDCINERARDEAMQSAHAAGYDASYDGVLRHDNPHPPGSDEHRAWEAGHLQAAGVRREWEESNG